MPVITKIPATRNPLTRVPSNSMTKRRVAGYARVSTGSEEQLTSYEAQVDYYTHFIQSKPEWEFVNVYTDEGISATNTKKRDGFNQMVSDALAGKIDLIVTKSVSRFARNTVDSLVTVRKLKEKGIEVYFEKENIYTLDSKGELLITIMSSLAQEESRSISENVTWGQRKRFADGKVSLPYKHFLGYRKGADGLPEIVPEEAETVRLIYRMFLQGKTTCAIAKSLTEQGILTPSGKQRWQSTTVESILTNEKYKGDALLQKAFTVDYLTKKTKKNEGEIPQYYVENSHPAIIPPNEWMIVQREFTRRKGIRGRYSGSSIFSSRLVCGDCGDFLGSKTWRSGKTARKTIWQCNSKYLGETRCTSPNLNESLIQEKYVTAVNTLISSKDGILDDCRMILDTLADSTMENLELNTLLQELEIVQQLIAKAIKDNSLQSKSQSEYAAQYSSLEERYKDIQAKVSILQEKIDTNEKKAAAISLFMFTLKEIPEQVTSFDSTLWYSIIDRGIANSDGTITFRFLNGTEITA